MGEPSVALQAGEEAKISDSNQGVSTSSASRSHSRQKNRRVVIVGIPGVGKSTVVKRVVDLMTERNLKTDIVNYGTTMMEEATRVHGLKSRDEMRKLPVEDQRRLQIYAAEKISRLERPFVIIDTHLFIVTREGFWPGMPLDVLRALDPTHLVLVSASLEEIRSRRENDTTRSRDVATLESLELEMDAAKTLLFASSLVCGCPALIVKNSAGQVDDAAKSIINSVFSN
ncbi:MAG: adenylate kinase [Thaumarchaeota archaeon]|nr:adenylate kinase [Nitrososphaerota archaeon]